VSEAGGGRQRGRESGPDQPAAGRAGLSRICRVGPKEREGSELEPFYLLGRDGCVKNSTDEAEPNFTVPWEL
jgi:hypothetical protein